MLRAGRLAASQRSAHYLYYSDVPQFTRIRNNLQIVNSLNGTAGFITLAGSLDYNVFRSYFLQDLSRAVFVCSI